MIKSRFNLPSVVNGYELNPIRGYFSVILPIERVNLITNPSFEINTTGYTSVDGATLTRNPSVQRRGSFSLQVKPGVSSVSGIYYTTSPLTSGQTYALSLDVFIRGGRKYQIRAFDGIRSIITKPVTGKGYWERVSFVFTAVTSGVHRLYLEKNDESSNTNTDDFYTDGWQLELCEAGNYWATTYLDGDQTGFVINQTPPAYYWNGAAHASSSTRNGQTRAGGHEVRLLDYGLRVIAILGLGMTPLVNVATPLSIGGGLYQRTTQTAREFSLVGSIMGSNASEVYRRRIDLISDFTPDRTGFQQSILLRYQQMDDCGDPTGQIIDIPCYYSGGLEGNTDNLNQEPLAVKFQLFDTTVNADGSVSQTLDFADDLNQKTGGIFKYSNNSWSQFTTENYNNIPKVIRAQGFIYILTSGQPFIRIENDGTGTLITVAAGGTISTIIPSLDQTRIYLGGNFTSIGGVVAAGLAYYTISTGLFTAVTTSISAFGVVSKLEFGDDGTLYVGGAFTTIDALTVSGIAKVSASGVWSKLTSGAGVTGAGASVGMIKFSPDGHLYVGGDFTTIDGSAFAAIAKFRISDATWLAMGAGVTGGFPLATSIALGGLIYVSGSFTTAGGITVNYIAAWNGTTWLALGSGLDSASSDNFIDSAGNLYVLGGMPNSESEIGIWNGSKFIPLAIKLMPGAFPSTGTWASFFNDTVSLDIYASTSNGPYAIVGANNTITYEGIAPAWPTIIITGSGELWQISNNTTNRYLIFENLTLISGEVVTIITKPGSVAVTSNFRGNMLAYISPASDLSEFFLQPGDNEINAMMITAGPNASIRMLWKNTYYGIEGSIRR